MALSIGDQSATSGMSKDIYDRLNQLLSPAIKDDPPGTLAKAQTSWQQLAFAIATGVVTHIKANMQISGIQVTGTINAAVTGTVAGTAVTGTATGTLNSNQTGATTGLVS